MHVFAKLRPDKALSDVLRDLKSNASGWMHDVFPELKDFSWQRGYGAFTVSASQVGSVRDYIARQKEHHRRQSFREEFIAFLRATTSHLARGTCNSQSTAPRAAGCEAVWPQVPVVPLRSTVPDVYTTRVWQYSYYIRDQWQVTPKLTFTFGTRYERFPYPYREDRGVERYDIVNNKMFVCGVGVVGRKIAVLSKATRSLRLGSDWPIAPRTRDGDPGGLRALPMIPTADAGRNVSNMTLNTDGTIRSLGGYTVLNAVKNGGRQGVDERVFRFGVRLSF